MDIITGEPDFVPKIQLKKMKFQSKSNGIDSKTRKRGSESSLTGVIAITDNNDDDGSGAVKCTKRGFAVLVHLFSEPVTEPSKRN